MTRLLSFAYRGAIVFALACLLFMPTRAQQADTPVTPQATQSQQLPSTAISTDPARAISVEVHDLSPWSMFMQADWVVKAIMIGLAFASVLTWTTFFAKFVELFLRRSGLTAALAAIKGSRSLQDALTALGKRKTVLRSYLLAAMEEEKLSSDVIHEEGIKERAASSFSEITRAETRRIRLGMGLLATIASTSPFVGLFGTVWGIMNSFIGISKSQTTNLAVVAPGIAEALLATALGLFAAIPAVVIYNHFSRVTKTYLELANRASGASGRLLSRDLDRRRAGSASIASRAAE